MSKRKLLLADDSITIQKVVNLTFADEGIDVITVGDGDSAIAKISEVDPDVVLADVHMPGLNGYQVCEMIRQNPGTRQLPVVLLVGSFEPFDEAEAARVGANAYLTKPFQSIRQLVSQVSQLMESVAPAIEDESPAESFQTEDYQSETFSAESVEVESVESAEYSYVAEAPPASDGETKDTSDIDALYTQSFGSGSEASESDDVESGPPRYVDAGMDDEMIETTHTSDEYDRESVAAAVSDAFAGPGSSYEASQQTVPEYSAEPAAGAFDSYAREEEQNIATAEGEQEFFDQFSKTEQMPLDESQRTTDEYELDDSSLLELPPIDNGNAAGSESAKQVVNLSPELMEIIVQRVVEKLAKNENQ